VASTGISEEPYKRRKQMMIMDRELITVKCIYPMARRPVLILILAAVLIFPACAPQNKTQQGALVGAGGGAAAGALVGQLIGRNTESTLIGAAIGAAIGGAAGAGVGHMMDNQEREMRQALANSEAAAVRREGNLLAVTLRGDVTFDFDSAVVKPGAYSELERIAGVVVNYPDTVLRVEGHTDSIGPEEYNMVLSSRRAEAVKNILIAKGVPSRNIETIAYGESMPVATNETEAGRMKNRRVEIKIAPRNY
jgi:outer membrane protein OmpA-like peptidoglycan-associated protein